MLQRYRLRLGDGTVLNVDNEGLRTWVEDDPRAMVQVAGTQQWRPLRELLAEEESAARLARALVPPEPRRPPAVPPREPEPPAFEPAIGEPPVQALAEEPSAPVPPWQVPPEAPGTEAPAIRLKPLDAQARGREGEADIIVEEPQDPYAVPRPRAYDALEEEEDVVRHDSLEGPLLQVVTALGTVLSRLLDPLTPLVRGWPSRSGAGAGERAVAPRTPPTAARRAPVAAAPLPEAPAPLLPSPEPPRPFEPTPATEPPPRVSVLAEDPGLGAGPRADRDEPPVIPPSPFEGDEGSATSALRGLTDKAREWLAAVSAWVAGLPGRIQALRARTRRDGEVAPPIEPATRKAPPPASGAVPVLRDALQAPTPAAELPSIRFAEGWEPPEEGDVYEGGEETAWSILPILWMWTKRIVLIGGLAAACALAALERDSWFPRAARLGETVFTEIDRQAHSAQRARTREQAVANATERCPHLASETIRLVLSTSSDRVLEPAEVFQIATDAADRGVGSLPAAEAAELQQLRRDLLARLRPPQRARLAEYDRARATRVVFPFENPPALDLVARGARALPAASRARLQHLLGKAVAAGLAPASAPAAGDAPPAATR